MLGCGTLAVVFLRSMKSTPVPEVFPDKRRIVAQYIYPNCDKRKNHVKWATTSVTAWRNLAFGVRTKNWLHIEIQSLFERHNLISD
jgi:hypothetical protein